MITITENIYLFPTVDNGKVYLLVINFENVKHVKHDLPYFIVKKGLTTLNCLAVSRTLFLIRSSVQGRTKWRNCRLTTKTPEYQLGWAILDDCKQLNNRLKLDTHKCSPRAWYTHFCSFKCYRSVSSFHHNLLRFCMIGSCQLSFTMRRD